jgi:arginine repressor
VDNSFSMRQGGLGNSRLDRAKREALGVVNSLSGGDRGQVLALNSQVHLLTQATDDRQELRAAAQSVVASDSRGSYAELARAARSIAPSARLPLQIHLFSDMQRSSLPAAFADLRLPLEARLVLHPVADKRLSNWAVENVKAPRRFYDPAKAQIQVTVAGYGAPAAEKSVSLVVNNKVLGTKTVKVPENGRATVEFLKIDAPHGLNRGEIRIQPGDQFPDDDKFSVALERSDPSRILFVYDARQPGSLLYFRTALESASDAAFALDSITTDQIAGVAPGKYAAIVLSDVSSIPQAFEDALKTYVKGGGGVLIAAGSAVANRPRIPVFDEAVQGSTYAARSAERFLMVGEVDPAHPSIRRANRWEGVKFYQVIRIAPGKAQVLARLSDDTPLLMEKRLGEGRVLVFASTFDKISNDFPLHNSFVPFVEQTAHHLTGLEDRPATFPVDSFIELRSARDRGTAVEVLDPQGRRALSLQQAATAEAFQLNREGVWEVRRGNARNEVMAVNADRRESDLDLIPEDTLTLWRGTGQPAENSAGGGEIQEKKPWGFWWHLMLGVLLLGVTESLLASRYMGVGRDA